MTVHFNEKENKWIIKEPNNWHMKEGCPEPLRSQIRQKLDYIYDYSRRMEKIAGL